MASLNQDVTFDFISRDRMLDFISRQERSEQTRQEKLRLAKAAGLESFHRGEPIDRVRSPTGSPSSGFRQQPSPRPLRQTEAWVADQAERHLEAQRKTESKAAVYHAAQLHALAKDSMVLQRRAKSKERGRRTGDSPSDDVVARLSTRTGANQKTAALKDKLEKAREEEEEAASPSLRAGAFGSGSGTGRP